jgi:hypothetical protein
MIFDGNALVRFLKQNNVGGAVALPPASCLRAVHLSAHADARVERTGSPWRRHYAGTGPVRRSPQIHLIYHEERLR